MATPFDSNLSTPEHQIDPPLKTGFTSSMVFAFAIHGLLVAALTWGVNWHQKAETTGVQAELWSAQNQESAPSAMAQNTPTTEQEQTPPPPPPPPQVEPEKKAELIKTPVKPVEVNNEIKDAQIALEKAKKEKIKQEIEQEKKLKEKKEKEKAKAEQLEKEKQAEKNRLEQEKLDKVKAQKEKEKEKADKLAKEQKEAKAKADKLARQEQIKRLQNQAGAAGAESGTTANGIGKNNGNGTATQSSGPSAGYEGRVRARLKPNIVFTENINGNPSTEIEVRLAQDGMVLGKPKILRSSGVRSWDEAAVRAIEKTEIFPRDVDGKVPPIIILTLRPRE